MRRGGGIEAIRHRGPMRGPTWNYTRSRFAAKVFFANHLHNKSFTPGVLTPVKMGATISGCLKKSGRALATSSGASPRNTQLFRTITLLL